MADFAVFMVAAEPALGWEPGTFLDTYEANRRAANTLALDAAIVGPPLQALLEDRHEWTGTAEDLRVALAERVPEGVTRSRYWPKNAWAMSNALSRLSPNLRASGVEIERHRRAGGNRERLITLRDVRPRPAT